jgi:hypothetical protein
MLKNFIQYLKSKPPDTKEEIMKHRVVVKSEDKITPKESNDSNHKHTAIPVSMAMGSS